MMRPPKRIALSSAFRKKLVFFLALISLGIYSLTHHTFQFKLAAHIPEMSEQTFLEIYDFKYGNLPSTNSNSRPIGNASLPSCNTVPHGHVTKLTVFKKEYAPLSLLETRSFQLETGGHYKPKHCRPSKNLAVIIPFRKRDLHLSIWLLHMHPFLQRQNLSYTIFVVNQVSDTIFNKGVLMNSGFLEISKLDKFDCFIFHDVDLLPEDERINYTCSTLGIKHLAYALEEWNYQGFYNTLVGGAISISWQDYLKVNGFSNQYFGWGGEDDDFYERLYLRNITIIRQPLKILRFTMVAHKRDDGNQVNDVRYRLLANAQRLQEVDGLNNVKYTLNSIEKLPLFTRLNITFVPDEVRQAKPSKLEYSYTKGNG